MRHRRINVSEDRFPIAAIDSIIERGSASDMRNLLKRIQEDPFGPVAENALKACEHSEVYGYPSLIRNCIEQWRAQDDRRSR